MKVNEKNIYYIYVLKRKLFIYSVKLSQDLDDNPPIITASLTTLTIKETDNLNDLIGISIEDIDKDYTNSRYTLELL